MDIKSTLKKFLVWIGMRGMSYDSTMLCPFHEEKTPSMVFNSKTRQYHCFGCGKNSSIDKEKI
jgi:DNA primase